MSFFLITLLGLTGSFSGLLVYRQATWKHSQFHNWLKAKRKEREELRKAQAEEEKKREAEHLEALRKADEEMQLSRKNVEAAHREWQAKRNYPAVDTDSFSGYSISGISIGAGLPRPTGSSTMNAIYIDPIAERDMKAEMEEENCRRQWIKQHGSMIGYRNLKAEVAEDYRRAKWLKLNGSMLGYVSDEEFRARSRPNPPMTHNSTNRPMHRIEDAPLGISEPIISESQAKAYLQSIFENGVLDGLPKGRLTEVYGPESGPGWSDVQSDCSADTYDSGCSECSSDSE